MRNIVVHSYIFALAIAGVAFGIIDQAVAGPVTNNPAAAPGPLIGLGWPAVGAAIGAVSLLRYFRR